MRVYRLQRCQRLEADIATVFQFFSAARNLERLTPDWLRFEVLTPEPIDLREGTVIDYRLRLHGLPLTWRSRIESWEPPHAFVDRQLRGPYRLWHHRHEFTPAARGTDMHDVVHYGLPLGPAGRIAHALLVRRDLTRIFDYRHQEITRWLATSA
jgi:ligand-binding SRPBCC domain-containing protein